MLLLVFTAGFVIGTAVGVAACFLWAWRAMGARE